jgi:hypothetical protein
MIPSNSNDVISSTSTTQNNVGSSGWSWGYFPDSNISADGGMVWLPNEPDPFGGIGVWMMKKRAGGNSESQFVGQAPGAIDTNSTYTLSVYCKANVANTARIHINVTLNGASNWSYASSTHTGDGSWQRLTLTIPGGVGITSINVVRCQSLGTTTNTNIYWKYFQIEAKPYATPFVNGTRGTTVATGGGFGDLSGNSNHGELVNGLTYNSSNLGSLVFDGVDDYVSIPSFTFTPYCLDFWLYNNNVVPGNDASIGGPSTYQTLIAYGYPAGVNLGGWTGGATNEALHIWSTTGGNRLTYTQAAVPIGYHNWVFNWNGSNYDIWVDGVKQTVYASTSGHALLQTFTSTIRLANNNSSYYFNGKIYSFKLYTSQLNDSQVIQNYNATKGRYGL